MMLPLLLGLLQAAGLWSHPYDAPQAESFPAELWAVIEIPSGGGVKYELDPVSGRVLVDRFVQTPLRYPGSYGSIPRTHAEDGDPLDVLVVAREPLHPGVMIRVRPIGVLRLVDSGDQDDKVIAVPARDVDPTFDAIADVADLPALDLRRIEMFFEEYERLPAGERAQLQGVEGREAALVILNAAASRYQSARRGLEP